MTVTLKDIAQRLGVSVATVSRALGGYDVAEETRERVFIAVREMGYHPNITAQNLQRQRTNTLGFVIPTDPKVYNPPYDPFFMNLLSCVVSEAAKLNYDLLITTTPAMSVQELELYQRWVRGRRVDGFIIARSRCEDERITFLLAERFPFVVFGRTSLEVDYLFLDVDGAAGVSAAVEHLYERGHRQIGFLVPPKDFNFSHHRLAGYKNALAAHDLPYNAEWMLECKLTQADGEECMQVLLDRAPAPTAVIAGNDLVAIGAMRAVQKRGLRVGTDVAVVGFDDIAFAEYTNPALTTIHQPIDEIGARLTQMLIRSLQEAVVSETQVMLSPRLVIRESS